MKRLTVIAATAVSTLVLAAPALAKEMTLLQVCGPEDCNPLEPALALGHDGGSAGQTPLLQSYYVLKASVGDGKRIFERFEMYFAPRAGAVIGANVQSTYEGWSRLPVRVTAALRRAAKGLKPFRPAQPNAAHIGSRRSVDPPAYVDLLGPLPPAEIPDAYEPPISIEIIWAKPHPWTTGAVLYYLPKAKVLFRGGTYFKVPEAIAGRIDRERRGLPPVAPGDGFPWGALAGGLAGVLALAAATVVLARRRRPRPAEGAVPA